MHADAAVTGLSRTPATAARNTVQPLADVVNVTLKSKSGQTANHIEGRSFANVLQWSISAAGAALFATLTVTGLLSAQGAINLSGLLNAGSDLVLTTDALVRRSIDNGILEVTAGKQADSGANLKMWGPSHVNGYDFALRGDTTNVLFYDASAGTMLLSPLAGSGTRVVTADATGTLGTSTTTSLGLVTGTGTANRVAYWSGTSTLTSSGNLTWNGTALVLTGTQTISSTLGVTGVVTLTDLAGTGTRLVQASSTGVLSTTTSIAFGLVSGTGTANQVAYWSSTTALTSSGNLTWNGTALVLTGTQTISSTLGVTGAVTLTTLVGTGTRLATASATGVLGSTTATAFGLVSGTGTANRVAYWSATDTVTSSANLTFDGTALVLTGTQTISSTLGVTGVVTLTNLAGTGTRIVTASSTGVLSTSSAILSGSGTLNQVAYWSSTTALTSSGNLTFDGSTLALTGAQTISSTLDVTGRSSFTGVMGIGTASSTDTALYILSSNLTGSTQLGIACYPTFSSATTGTGGTIGAQVRTAAASFTMATGIGVQIFNASKGAASAITTLYGLKVEDQTGGGTNFAIRTGLGAVRFGGALTVDDTTTLSSTLAVTGTSTLTGNVGIGTAAISNQALTIRPASMTGGNQYGLVSDLIFVSSATSSGTAIYAQLRTAASSFTMTNGYGMFIDVPSKGASSAVTNMYGINVSDITGGATLNLAIRTGAGIVRFGDTTEATNSSSAAVRIDGGLAIVKSTWSASYFLSELTGKNSYVINSAGANFGYISNTASNTWALSYGTVLTTLGTSALTWNSSGVVTVPGTLTVTGAVTATGGIVFNGGGTNLNHYEVGTYTGTLTGCTTSPTFTVTYVRVGNMVTLLFPSDLTATSNTTACTITGAPAAIRPTTAQALHGIYLITDGATSIHDAGAAYFMEMQTSGTINLINNGSSAGFSGSGTKGFKRSNSIGVNGGVAVSYCMS